MSIKKAKEFLKNNDLAFIKIISRDKIAIPVVDCKEEKQILELTPEDVAHYYAYWANNISSGIRVLGKFASDWRYVDNIARTALEIFKVLDIKKMRKVSREFGLIPKF